MQSWSVPSAPLRLPSLSHTPARRAAHPLFREVQLFPADRLRRHAAQGSNFIASRRHLPAARSPGPPTPAPYHGAGRRPRSLRRSREPSRLESEHDEQDRRRPPRHPRPSTRPEAPPRSGAAPAARDRLARRSTTPVARSGTSRHPLTSAQPRHDSGPPDPHPGAAGESRTTCQSESTDVTRCRRCSRSSSTVIRSGHVPA